MASSRRQPPKVGCSHHVEAGHRTPRAGHRWDGPLLCTDPPFNLDGRTAKERASRSVKQKYTSADAQHALPDFTGEDMDQRPHGFWLTHIMTEAHRLTKPGGTALLFTTWCQMPTTTDVLQTAGWLLTLAHLQDVVNAKQFGPSCSAIGRLPQAVRRQPQSVAHRLRPAPGPAHLGAPHRDPRGGCPSARPPRGVQRRP